MLPSKEHGTEEAIFGSGIFFVIQRRVVNPLFLLFKCLEVLRLLCLKLKVVLSQIETTNLVHLFYKRSEVASYELLWEIFPSSICTHSCVQTTLLTFSNCSQLWHTLALFMGERLPCRCYNPSGLPPRHDPQVLQPGFM